MLSCLCLPRLPLPPVWTSNDDFDISSLAAAFASLSVYSSTDDSTSSAEYFVDEPDAEPEP